MAVRCTLQRTRPTRRASFTRYRRRNTPTYKSFLASISNGSLLTVQPLAAFRSLLSESRPVLGRATRLDDFPLTFSTNWPSTRRESNPRHAASCQRGPAEAWRARSRGRGASYFPAILNDGISKSLRINTISKLKILEILETKVLISRELCITSKLRIFIINFVLIVLSWKLVLRAKCCKKHYVLIVLYIFSYYIGCVFEFVALSNLSHLSQVSGLWRICELRIDSNFSSNDEI